MELNRVLDTLKNIDNVDDVQEYMKKTRNKDLINEGPIEYTKGSFKLL